MATDPNKPFAFDESGMKRAVRAIQAYERSSGGKGVDISKPTDRSIGATDSPDTIGGNSEGSESADAATWVRNTDNTPVDVWVVGRVGYFHAGGEKLYAYARKLSFDALGALVSISAETRVEIDAPEDC